MVSDSSTDAAVDHKWTDGFEKRKKVEEEEESGGGGGVEELVWSLSTSRQLMKMDVRTQCPHWPSKLWPMTQQSTEA